MSLITHDVIPLRQYAKTIGNKRIHISDAKRGKGDYYCGECNTPLIAKKGNCNAHHFAHNGHHIATCKHSDESEVHTFAKEFLLRTKTVLLPPIHAISNENTLLEQYLCIETAKTFTAHAAQSEINLPLQNTSLNRFVRPDVLFYDANDKLVLLIEICVTHAVDLVKRLHLHSIGIPTIEIRLPMSAAPSEIETLLHHNSDNTKWLYRNPCNQKGVPISYIEYRNSDAQNDLVLSLVNLDNQLQKTVQTLQKHRQMQSFEPLWQQMSESVQIAMNPLLKTHKKSVSKDASLF